MTAAGKQIISGSMSVVCYCASSVIIVSSWCSNASLLGTVIDVISVPGCFLPGRWGAGLL